MQCPVCHIDLHMTERQGIAIDYCPQCRSVWLDRGELDRLIERSTADRSPADAFDRHVYERRGAFEERWDEDDEERHRYRGRRRQSFLGELFDFN
jgi:Zn-finger nucleic acid-binding protein